MSNLTKQALRVENNTNFPNNNTNFITPEKLRNFNSDMIDSVVTSDVTASFLTTGSNTFVGDQTIIGDVTLGNTNVINTNYIESVGPELNLNTTQVHIYNDLRVNNAITASAVSASIVGIGNVTSYSASVDYRINNITASAATQTLTDTVYNGEATTIVKGTPLYVSGSQGANPIVYRADASVASKMPVIYVANANITTHSTGEAIVLGHIEGMNLTGIADGTLVYVAEGGGWSTTRPSGSNSIVQPLGIVTKGGNGGKGEVLNPGPATLPNLQSGYIWIGNSGNQPTSIATSSLGYATLSGDNTFTGTNSFQSISAVSASFQHVTSVTGSAVIIGDAFVVVNNSTPTQPYGGLSVYDSGSVIPTTSSLVWDGVTNDWKYNYNVGTGHDAAVMLFGPAGNGIANTPYPTNNKVQKGTGGHHLADSSITDDGTLVYTNTPFSASGDITGQGLYLNDSINNGRIRFATGSGYFNIQLIPNDGDLAFSRDGVSNVKVMTLGGKTGGFTTFQNNAVQFQSTIGSAQFDAPVVINSGINSSVQITGSLTITPSSVSTNAGYPIPFLSSNTFAKDSVDTLMYNPSTNTLYVSASTGQSNITPSNIGFVSGSGQYGTYASTISKTGYTNVIEGGNYIGLSGNPSKLGAPSVASNTKPAILALSGSGQPYVAIEFQPSGSTTFTDGGITAKRRFVVEQGLEVTGSISSNINPIAGTATLNANLGNTWEWSLTDGVTNTLSISNQKAGQTLNVLVVQGSLGTGTVAFSANFLQPSGSFYTASAVANATDILTLATFGDTSKVYVASVNRFI
jgi:hypothetical protein